MSIVYVCSTDALCPKMSVAVYVMARTSASFTVSGTVREILPLSSGVIVPVATVTVFVTVSVAVSVVVSVTVSLLTV